MRGLAAVTRGLTVRYGRVTALEGVDFAVPEGAVYALVGVNGAGKSTLLKALMNLVRPVAGTAEAFGLDVAARGPEARAAIGYVPERPDPGYRWMTCGRLLAHVAAYRPSWDADYAARLAAAFDLRPERRVGALSKGESRRLQLALALAHRPPLLLLDEPTDGLDPVVRRRALALLAEHLADSPTTVLIATHHLHEVETLADHVGALRGGRLVVQAPREELRRTVRRYRIEVPEAWAAPPIPGLAAARRAAGGREVQAALVGDERAVTERLAASGARVREAAPMALEDAVLALLSDGEPA